MGELLDECNQLCNIIGQSIVTTKENKKRATAAAISAGCGETALKFALFNFHFSVFNVLAEGF